MRTRAPMQGFTLLELLVAVAVFAVLAAMSYGGLTSVLETGEAARAQGERLKELQLAVAWLERDISQMVDRTSRDEYGDSRPALEIAGPEGGLFAFTRAGRPNPLGDLRSSLQRVSYGLQDEALVRAGWTMVDRAPGSRAARHAVAGCGSAGAAGAGRRRAVARNLAAPDRGPRPPRGSGDHPAPGGPG